ncbi:hypothetical protein [Cellulomonas edaphi]|uniref:Uncharacterized protein n=1 Tax=Cellulomonas edaphi TaxID=3053468 RepID=A0ABT7S9D6_9CELL|nr:hypothetical protein [Cellulomons edaphi]MDM7831637.1 hypothetical protein [Cellulomons edaphi]
MESRPDDSAAVRTLRFDGGWFTVVGRRLAGEVTTDPWHAIARGRRTAQRLGRPHVIDLPGETVVEDPDQLEAGPEPPWGTPAGDPHAGERVRSAGERAARARARLAELRSASPTDLSTVDAALASAREAQRQAAAAGARSAATYEHSALAHEAAADVHERLAAFGAEPARHRARADEHGEPPRRTGG